MKKTDSGHKGRCLAGYNTKASAEAAMEAGKKEVIMNDIKFV